MIRRLAPSETAVNAVRPYLWPAAAAVATLGSALYVLFSGDAQPVLLAVAAIGAPVTALLLARAAAGGGEDVRPLLPSFLIGATLVPALVLLLHGIVAVIAYALIEPLAQVATGLLDGLRADPTLLEIFTSPWWFFFLVELAVVAPLGEEALKPLGSIIRRPRSRAEAFLFGVAAGAGFAAIEDLLYAAGAWSAEGWLAVAMARASGAALHLLGAGLVSLAAYEVRTGTSGPASLLRLYGIAVAIHSLWNGAIGVAIVLFNEREIVAGGLSGSALSWGIALMVFLGALGAMILGALVATSRWVARTDSSDPLLAALRLDRPRAVAAWAALAASLLVPATILILAFPGFLAL